MRKQLLKSMKVLLVAAGLCVGVNDAWAGDPIETVNASFASGYRAAFSSAYTLASGKTLNLEFINYNNGTSTQWNNYILEATSAVGVHDGVYFDMRADNYAFDAGTFGKTYSGNYLSDLDGATVNFAISYSSETGIIEVNGVVTTTTHAVYPLNYNYTVEAKPANVVIYLTEESAKLEIMKADIVDTGNITGLPFYTAFTNVTTPFDSNGALASNSSIGKVLTVTASKNSTKSSVAYFDTNSSTDGYQPYTIGNTETVTISMDCYNGYNGNSTNDIFAVVNSDDVILASFKYNNKSGQYEDIAIGGNTIDDYEAFACRSQYNTNTANGYGGNGKPFVATSGYNPHVEICIAGNGKVEVTITKGYGNVSHTYSKTLSDIKMDLAQINVTNEEKANQAANSDRVVGYDNLIISSTTVAKTTYTVQFHDGEGNELADDAEYEIYVGNTFSASAEDVARVFYNGDESVKYANPTGNTPQTAVADAASNVITLVFTSYAKMNYTLNAVEKDNTSNVLVNTLVSGYVYSDSPSATINLPWYVVNGGTLYNQSSNQTTKTVESNNQVFTVEYTATETTGVVYYAEAETMTGRSRTISNTIASNRGTGTFNDATYFTTLPRGKYYFYVREHSGNSSGATLTVKAGDEIVGTNSFPGATNNQTYTSDEFSIYTFTDLTIQYPGGNATGIDYIYIVKTADIPENISATLGTNGYATFANTYPLDLTTANLPSGLTAYKAAVSGTIVTFTALNQTVPANTGILLKGDASETYSIPVVSSGTDVTENAFLVNEGGATFTADDNYYYFGLMKNSLTFGQFAPGDVAIPADKAYLKVLKSSIDSSPSRELTVVFDDEATGIKSVIDPRSTINGYYNLNGQRVSLPTKGLYIQNGKKVILK